MLYLLNIDLTCDHYPKDIRLSVLKTICKFLLTVSKEDREYKKWSIFLIHADMIMYLIDSTKKDELGFNTGLLKYTLKNNLLVNSQVLVVATKQVNNTLFIISYIVTFRSFVCQTLRK